MKSHMAWLSKCDTSVCPRYPAHATMVPREMDQTPDSARSNLFSREITGQRDNLLHAVNQRRDFSRAGDIPPWTVKDVVSVVA